jgi:hypothetical protein
MRRRLIGGAAAVVAAAVAVSAVALAAEPDALDVPGFDTTRPAQLVATAPGVEIDPWLSVGDIVGGELGGYQMTGIPDGIGAYGTSKNTFDVLFNHELDGTAPAGVGTRISHISVVKGKGIVKAGYDFDGTEGFLRFCSSTLALLDKVPWYFTGEESTSSGPPPPGGRGGSSIALNTQTGRWYETRHFGLFAHENVVPLKQLSSAFMLSTEDGPAGLSQLYAYTAATFPAAIRGEGQLWVWRPDGEAPDGNWSTNDIAKGQTLAGHFVALSQAENADAATLEAAAQAKGAFDFVRGEDAAAAVDKPGVAYFSDTGALGTESVKGRLYRLDVDPADTTAASLTVLLDGDAGDDMVNPDNLDTSSRSVVIQEDRNAEHRAEFGRVLVYDIKNRTVRAVARVDTPSSLPPGNWESSGVIRAFGLLGKGWWILDVQAHGQSAPQPGPGLEPNSSTGEDGQLLAIKIPNS